MDKTAVMEELERLGTGLMKKRYISNGAREPLFGVATGAMKPLSKQIRINQDLAEELYATGNYDAMYFAGVIADPRTMSEADYERWMDRAYFFMISDYIVAVTLSESAIGQQLSDKWIRSEEELRRSAGWSCCCWMLGSRPDDEFDRDKLAAKLITIKDTIDTAPPRARKSMCNFVYTAATSYIPLHVEAVETAQAIGIQTIERGSGKAETINTYEDIQKQLERGRLGFKRRYVRC